MEPRDSLGIIVPLDPATCGVTTDSSNHPAPSVLIVDDSPVNCLMLRQCLKHTPYEVDEAHDGAVALAKVKARRYDFIVMDLLMPEMDGFEAMREIRCWEDAQGAAPACIIIITLTAWELKEARHESLMCGADAHLTKPIDKAKLLEVLHTQRARIGNRR